MTLSAWRPLKDAPKKDGAIVAVRRTYRLDGDPTVPHAVATCRGTAWVWNDGDRVNISNREFVPIADTYELDRAVQVKIAEAFGEMIGRLTDEADCANFRHWGALAAFRDILHTAMGGRIPDEVP